MIKIVSKHLIIEYNDQQLLVDAVSPFFSFVRPFTAPPRLTIIPKLKHRSCCWSTSCWPLVIVLQSREYLLQSLHLRVNLFGRSIARLFGVAG